MRRRQRWRLIDCLSVPSSCILHVGSPNQWRAERRNGPPDAMYNSHWSRCWNCNLQQHTCPVSVCKLGRYITHTYYNSSVCFCASRGRKSMPPASYLDGICITAAANFKLLLLSAGFHKRTTGERKQIKTDFPFKMELNCGVKIQIKWNLKTNSVASG